MSLFKTTIIGLGLMGGSLAKVLRKKYKRMEIIAVNKSQMPIDIAINEGILNRGYLDINKDIFDSDIIFLCTPISQSMAYIEKIASKINKTCILTDVCSTKQEIVDVIENMPNSPIFIGGHPMAGTEQRGYGNSFPELFNNSYYIITPCKSSTPHSIQILLKIIKKIGAIPIMLDAKKHDNITGYISHVPHIIAAGLVNIVKGMEPDNKEIHKLVAGGFKDITRIASSDPFMWQNIILSNKDNIRRIIKSYIELLQGFENNLDNSNSEMIYNFFETAKEFRKSFS